MAAREDLLRAAAEVVGLEWPEEPRIAQEEEGTIKWVAKKEYKRQVLIIPFQICLLLGEL